MINGFVAAAGFVDVESAKFAIFCQTASLQPGFLVRGTQLITILPLIIT